MAWPAAATRRPDPSLECKQLLQIGFFGRRFDSDFQCSTSVLSDNSQTILRQFSPSPQTIFRLESPENFLRVSWEFPESPHQTLTKLSPSSHQTLRLESPENFLRISWESHEKLSPNSQTILTPLSPNSQIKLSTVPPQKICRKNVNRPWVKIPS